MRLMKYYSGGILKVNFLKELTVRRYFNYFLFIDLSHDLESHQIVFLTLVKKFYHGEIIVRLPI